MRFFSLLRNAMTLFLLSQSAQGAVAMQQPIQYILNFNTYNALCIASVNGVETLANYYEKGPIAAGLNTAAFLENGTNTLTLEVSGLAALDGDYDYPADLSCQLMMSTRVPDKDISEGEVELFKLVATVNDKLQPTGLQSTDYQGKEGLSAVTEGQVEGSILYRVSRDFTVSGLPAWAWTKAAPFKPTEENIAELRQAYLEMQQILQAKNRELIKEKYKIAFEEQELASGQPQGAWYSSLDIDEALAESSGTSPINWDDYQLVILNQGRLVQYDNQGISPLNLKNQQGEGFFGLAPYFSIIDGKITIVR